MKLLIVGYGKMGRLIDQLAGEEGLTVVGRVDAGRDEWAPADAVIDVCLSKERMLDTCDRLGVACAPYRVTGDRPSMV